MAKFMLELGGRTVYWEIPEEVAAIIGQSLVGDIGPAEEAPKEYGWAGDAQATTFYATREEAEEHLGSPKRFSRYSAGPWREAEG